jgi:hypothetical protein
MASRPWAFTFFSRLGPARKISGRGHFRHLRNALRFGLCNQGPAIDQPAVIEKVLTHLGLWPAHAHTPAESLAAWRHRGIPPEGWRAFRSASSGPPDPLGRFGPDMSALRTPFGLTSSPRPWQPCAGFGPCPGLPRPRGRRCPPPGEKKIPIASPTSKLSATIPEGRPTEVTPWPKPSASSPIAGCSPAR